MLLTTIPATEGRLKYHDTVPDLTDRPMQWNKKPRNRFKYATNPSILERYYKYWGKDELYNQRCCPNYLFSSPKVDPYLTPFIKFQWLKELQPEYLDACDSLSPTFLGRNTQLTQLGTFFTTNWPLNKSPTHKAEPLRRVSRRWVRKEHSEWRSLINSQAPEHQSEPETLQSAFGC